MTSPAAIRVWNHPFFHATAIAIEQNDLDAREAGMRRNIAHPHCRPASRTVWNERRYFSNFAFPLGIEKHRTTGFIEPPRFPARYIESRRCVRPGVSRYGKV